MNERNMRIDPDRENPFDEVPDDRLCSYCGAPLEANPTPGSFPFMGFCDRDCSERAGGDADEIIREIAEELVADAFGKGFGK